MPAEENHGGPSAYVLAAGYAAGRPFIVEVNSHAMLSHYEDIGFHAIGSGAPMAQQAGTLLAHFRMTERRVGGPIDVARLTPQGARHLDEGEIEETRAVVERWADREQQALDDLFG